jgi:Holliday junction resolvase RusA-like endonuclease
MQPITFSVPGDPVPQPRPRYSARGGFARAYVAWEDDSQVSRLVVEKSYGDEGRTTVRIA